MNHDNVTSTKPEVHNVSYLLTYLLIYLFTYLLTYSNKTVHKLFN